MSIRNTAAAAALAGAIGVAAMVELLDGGAGSSALMPLPMVSSADMLDAQALDIADRDSEAEGRLEVTLVGALPDDRAAMVDPELVFCLPDVLQGDNGCLTKKALLSMPPAPVNYSAKARGQSGAMSVTMVHPTDFAEPEREVDDCESYSQLKRRNWGPMTTADGARESMFLRFCGLRSIALTARQAPSTPFSAAGLTRAELAAIKPVAWPSLGEPDDEAINFRRDDDDRRRWLGDRTREIGSLYDVALVDLDKDGEAERLLYVATRARGGTAGYAGFFVMDMTNRGPRVIPVVWR